MKYFIYRLWIYTDCGCIHEIFSPVFIDLFPIHTGCFSIHTGYFSITTGCFSLRVCTSALNCSVVCAHQSLWSLKIMIIGDWRLRSNLKTTTKSHLQNIPDSFPFLTRFLSMKIVWLIGILFNNIHQIIFIYRIFSH